MIKPVFYFVIALAWHNLIHAQQSVGIGTNNPISMLTVARGIHLDLDNVNGTSMQSALTFGGNKLVGIGSPRLLGSDNINGLDFYTNGLRRMAITSGGMVGINVLTPTTTLSVGGTGSFSSNLGVGNTNPQYRLHVSGSAYVSGNTGLGVPNPDYALHTNFGYVTDRLGVGTPPSNATYALNVLGSTLLQGNTRNTGWLAINEYLRVRSNKGIVRNINSTQLKAEIFEQTGYSLAGLQPGSSVTGNLVSFSETYGSTPIVLVGPFTGGNFTTGNPYAVIITATSISASSCRFTLTNVGNNNVSGTNISFQVLVFGVE
ncbi:MAG TPA: hypothetical protein PKD90_06855 [Phnomibacter sp.]|nr:hypothetical protein [Phnomibacter sp.]